MSPKNIVIGQKITPEKRELARQLRQNMTPAERVLWEQLRANRLDGYHFRRQQIIDGFIVDFYCHRAALVIEVDGPIHETQEEADAEREAVLKGRDLSVLRFTNRQVMNRMNEVLREIRQFLQAEKPTSQHSPKLGGVETHPPAPSQPGRGSFSLEFGSLKRGIEKGMPLL